MSPVCFQLFFLSSFISCVSVCAHFFQKKISPSFGVECALPFFIVSVKTLDGKMVWLKGGAIFCYFLLFSAILGVWIFFIFWPWFGLLLKGGEMRDS